MFTLRKVCKFKRIFRFNVINVHLKKGVQTYMPLHDILRQNAVSDIHLIEIDIILQMTYPVLPRFGTPLTRGRK